MIDHTGFNCSDLARSRAFYAAALAPIDYAVLIDLGDVIGLGVVPMPDFWLAKATPNTPRVHIAFHATSRAQVDAFHAAAIAAGGTDNGAPGLRPQYHPSYYGAFVLDPDGHNVEVVCHQPE